MVGLEIADRYRELMLAFRGPLAVTETLRRAAGETGYTHCLGRFVGTRVAITAVVEGVRSPYLDELISGYDEAAHATAMGKALLATMTPDQRWRFLKETGMRAYTSATITSPEALDAELSGGDRRGMQIEIGQYRPGAASAAVLLRNDRDPEQRVALGCAVPAADLMTSAKMIRNRLTATARLLAEVIDEPVL